MEIQAARERARKSLEVTRNNLARAERRGAPEGDLAALRGKVDFWETVDRQLREAELPQGGTPEPGARGMEQAPAAGGSACTDAAGRHTGGFTGLAEEESAGGGAAEAQSAGGKYGKTRHRAICRKCGQERPYIQTDDGYFLAWDAPFCPGCGAKMDKE